MRKKLVILLATLAMLVSLLCVNAFGAGEAAVPVITPRYPSLSFEGAVMYNVYFSITNGDGLSMDDLGLITFDTDLADGTIDDAVDVIPGAEDLGTGLYYVHTNGIPAKNLGDTVYFKIYARLADGSYVYSKTYSYSAVAYVVDRLNNSTNQELHTLLLKMLDYGAAAQEYFDYKTDSLMNDCFTNNKHQYGDWIVETPAALGTAGTRYRACSVCGARETSQIAPLTVASLAVTSDPAKTFYYSQESFDPTGMAVTATLSDGSVMTVTEYTVDKTVLTAADTSVTVSFGGQTAAVSITVSEYVKASVSELSGYETGTTLVVEGYYVGVAEEGPSTDKEMLIKDVNTDDIIAVRNVTYGTFPDYGYEKGDLIRVLATWELDGSVNTPNKHYLDFSAENGEQADTVVSSGNEVTYQLSSTVKVSSWEEMQALFAVGTVSEYTYIEFTGDLYFNRYAGSDGVALSRMHLNSAAAGVSGIKPDGTRTVSLRDNVMAANLGESWVNLFFDEMPATGSYPGYKLKGTLTALYTGGNNYYFQLTVLDESWVELVEFDNYDVVTEVAYAFYRQGNQIQYDMTQSRRNMNVSPEDATAQNTIYLDCSSYINAVYNEAFGVNVLPDSKTPSTSNYTNYAKENAGTAVDAIGYWENADYTTDAQIAAILAEVRGQLQVGDVLVYRHGETSGSGGHVYIYVGDDTFLHCTGSSYVYGDTPSVSYDKGTTDEKTIGAVQLISADDIFTDTSNKRYLFKVTASDSVYNFSLLRPLNRGLTPTEESKNRMKTAGIVAEKSVSPGQYNTVCAGETITYTVTLNNVSSVAVTGVALVETLPSGVTYVSGDLTASGETLTWTGKLAANSAVTLTYSVRVDAAAESGALIESSQTTVNGVEINDLTNTVSGYTDSQLASVAETAREYASSGQRFADPILMALAVYEDALGTTLFDHSQAVDVLSDVIDSGNDTCVTTTDAAKMLVPNLYGGLDIKSGFVTDPNRTRLVIEDYLAVGDIIVAEYDGISDVFVYIGNGTLIGVNSADGVCTAHTISGDAYSSSNILVTLIAYDRYAVLRPSMVA